MKLLFILLSLCAYAKEYKCPKGTYKVDYTTEHDYIRKIICYSSKGAGDKKEGPEIHLDTSGKVIYQALNKDGKKISEGNVMMSAPKQNNNKLYSEALSIIRELIKISEFNKDQNLATASFKNNNCQGKRSDWIKLFLMKRSFTHTYKFGQNCDLQGTWTPKLEEFFKANFKLKDLKEFNQVSFKLKFDVQKSPKQIIRFDIKEGILKGKKHTFKFVADYQGDVNLNKTMRQRVLNFNNQRGEVHFTEHNGKEISVKEKFTLNGR